MDAVPSAGRAFVLSEPAATIHLARFGGCGGDTTLALQLTDSRLVPDLDARIAGSEVLFFRQQAGFFWRSRNLSRTLSHPSSSRRLCLLM